MKYRLYSLILTLLCLEAVYSDPSPTGPYANSLELEAGNYYLLWNFTQTDILIEVHAKTTGWLGFGISPNGGMDGADVVIAWLDANGKANFTDRHIRDRSVIVDKEQNWFPITVTNRNGYLVAKFTRKIKICDKSGEDMDIPDGTPFVIYSYGKNFDPNGDITYHDSRGTKSVQLTSALNTKVDIDMSQVETHEFRVDYTFDPEYSTVYYCQVFKLPNTWDDVKRHLIRYETLYTPGTESHFHHWVLNECSRDFETVYLVNNTIPDPSICVAESAQTSQWGPIFQYCRRTSLVWAVGGDTIQDFPSNLAYPVGGPDADFKYFFLEMHYDNPTKESGLRDKSGVKFYVTKNYRETEFGVITAGMGAGGLILPPKVERIEANYLCQKDCVNNLFDKTDEVTIFSTMPHTHLTGREVYSKIIRDGQEVAYIANNKYYNFNYQYYNFLNPPVKFKRGDELSVTCVYNTMERTEFTPGGFTTEQEMCFVFVWYYPKSLGMPSCAEGISNDQWQPFLDKLIASGELASANISGIYDFQLPSTGASPGLADKIMNFMNQAEKSQQCITDKDFLFYPSVKEDIKAFQEPACTTDNNLYYLSGSSDATTMPVSMAMSTSSMTMTTKNSSPSSSITNILSGCILLIASLVLNHLFY